MKVLLDAKLKMVGGNQERVTALRRVRVPQNTIAQDSVSEMLDAILIWQNFRDEASKSHPGTWSGNEGTVCNTNISVSTVDVCQSVDLSFQHGVSPKVFAGDAKRYSLVFSRQKRVPRG